MNFDLRKHTIFLTLSGSRAYGFPLEDSDWDFKGIAIAPLYNYIFDKFEQTLDTPQCKHVRQNFPDLEIPENSEFQIMNLDKFINLALQSNPNILEILYNEKIYYHHPIMQKLLNVRDAVLSRKAKARFVGYSLDQLDRLKLHKSWLDSPPTHPPSRNEFGLPEYTLIPQNQLGAAEALIDKEVQTYSIDQKYLPEDIKVELEFNLKRILKTVWRGIAPHADFPIGKHKVFPEIKDVLLDVVTKDQEFSENFIEVLRRERMYRQAKKHWNNYQTWIKERNPKRAEMEKKFQIDTKFAVHIVRLLRMGEEILTQGKVIVNRPDWQELKAIRTGEAFLDGFWSYEKILDFAEKQNLKLNELTQTSMLPEQPNQKLIKQTVFEMIMEFNGYK